MKRFSASIGLIGFALFCAAACDGAGASQLAAPEISSGSERTPLAAAPIVEEPSVRQGINAPYFAPDGPERFLRILEAESREVVAHRDQIIDAIGLEEGMVVADIGAGTGLFTAEIARRIGDGGTVVAVDIVPEFVERIREIARAEGLANVKVVLGDERTTALGDTSVDLAFMCNTYHHIEYPQTYMGSLFRTLRPGGRLVLIDFERIEGTTNVATMKHVRAGKQTVIDEVSRAGFVLESEVELLDENYYLHFRRP